MRIRLRTTFASGTLALLSAALTPRRHWSARLGVAEATSEEAGVSSTPKIRPTSSRVWVALASIVSLLAAALGGVAVAPAHAADESVTIDFSATEAVPTYRASGWIYGMTEDASAPADHFFQDVKFRYMRAGGAQLDSPGGWVSGRYDRRWEATRAQLLRTQSLGGEFVLLVHDLWGADGFPISRVPGDNGDWTDYDNFLTRLIDDVRATGVPVQWDIWNEPNITLFWNRPQAQYFELWRRTYERIRAELPAHLIVGPSCACVPSTTHPFWNQYLDYVQANDVVPDIISWHALPGDPVANVEAANATLDQRGISHPRPYQINEYAAPDQQNPGDGSWYIARLERAGADGMRANWAGGANLHDDLASLLIRNSAGQHLPKGEWWAYRFYGSQTGRIVSVTPSASYDAFATKDTGVAKVLIGGGDTTGNIAVNLQHLDTTADIVQKNQVRVIVQRIPYNDGDAVQGPVTIQNSVVTLSDNATTVNVPHTNANDAFTLTVVPPSEGGFQTVAVAQHSQQCLDNTDLSTADGNQQQQYYCEGGDQQLWNFRPVAGPPNTYTVVNQQSGKCLGISGASTADGAPVVQSTCHGKPHQRFTLRKATYAGNDTHDYQLIAVHSGKCVEVNGTAPQSMLHQKTCNPVSQGSRLNQTWRLWGHLAPLDTSLAADAVNLSPGDSTTVTATMKNVGSSQIADLQALVKVAEGWQAEPTGTPPSTALAPGATTTGSWTITAPASVGAAVSRQPVEVELDFVEAGTAHKLSSSLDLTVLNPLTSLASFGSVPSLFGEFESAYTILTSGTDIWVGFDEYGTIYQENAAGTSATITARVTDMDNTDPWAKAGVAIRSDLTQAGTSAGYAAMVVTPGNGASFQWDASGNGFLDSFGAAGGITAPAWVRLVRSGDEVSGYYSTNGTDWIQVGPSVSLSGMTEQMDAGMIATSHNSGTTGQFEFSDFSVN